MPCEYLPPAAVVKCPSIERMDNLGLNVSFIRKAYCDSGRHAACLIYRDIKLREQTEKDLAQCSRRPF